MGTLIYVEKQYFKIKKSKFEGVRQAILNIGFRGDWCEETFSDDDISCILNKWRWSPIFDKGTGDIASLEFTGQKLGHEYKLFKALAPFVESGSYIQVRGGEDDKVWRYWFNGQTMLEIN